MRRTTGGGWEGERDEGRGREGGYGCWTLKGEAREARASKEIPLFPTGGLILLGEKGEERGVRLESREWQGPARRQGGETGSSCFPHG